MRPDGETALVSLSSFTEDAAAELRWAFGEAESKGATSYVLDLRGNPGGEPQEAVAAASLFLDGGQTVYFRENAGGGRERIEAADPTPFSGGDEASVSAPLVVLVDGGSASPRRSSPAPSRTTGAPAWSARGRPERGRCSPSSR